jgi:16S rRNA G966 N2-methylase RsmD
VTGELEVSELERKIMMMLVDDDATPLTEIFATMRAKPPLSSDVPVTREVIRDALRDLIGKGLARLVFYDPPYRWEDATPIPEAQAVSLLDQKETWIPPLENPEGRQVRATDTDLGRSIFF